MAKASKPVVGVIGNSTVINDRHNVQVVGQRTEAKDGYVALQLGAGTKKAKNTSKAERGAFASDCGVGKRLTKPGRRRTTRSA